MFGGGEMSQIKISFWIYYGLNELLKQLGDTLGSEHKPALYKKWGISNPSQLSPSRGLHEVSIRTIFRCDKSLMTSAMSARMSKRVTAESRARAARTMVPRLTEEQGSSANSEEAIRIVSPTRKHREVGEQWDCEGIGNQELCGELIWISLQMLALLKGRYHRGPFRSGFVHRCRWTKVLFHIKV